MQTSAAEVAAVLRNRIMTGEIAPGERMHQVQISEQLGISRTPVREALGQLASQGLLVYEPNRGYQVRAFTVEEVRAAFEIRARLEALGASLCARQGVSAAALETLSTCVATGDAILAKGRLLAEDLEPYRAMNVTFHDTILSEAKSPFLGDFVRQCYHMPLISDRVFVWEDYTIILRSHDDHRRIAAAIAARDAERADYLMREHVIFAGEVLLRQHSTLNIRFRAG